MRLSFLSGYLIITLLFTAISTNTLQAKTSKKQINQPPAIVLDLTLKGYDSFYINNLAFSPDGIYLAAFFNGEKLIKIYNTQSGYLLSTLSANLLYKHKNIDCIAFCGPDSSHIMIMRAGQPLKIINWTTNSIVKQWPVNFKGYRIIDFAVTPDKKYIAIVSSYGIEIWDYTHGKKLKTFLPKEKITSIDISPDGNYLVYALRDKTIENIGFIDLFLFDLIENPVKEYKNLNSTYITDSEIVDLRYYSQNKIIITCQDTYFDSVEENNTATVFMIDTLKKTVKGPVKLNDYRLLSIKKLSDFGGLIAITNKIDSEGNSSSAVEFIEELHFKKIKSYSNRLFKGTIISATISNNANLMAVTIKNINSARLLLYKFVKPDIIRQKIND